ncbi:MAG: hypothetical protein ACI8PZ_005377 [Myxococcota bacterium]
MTRVRRRDTLGDVIRGAYMFVRPAILAAIVLALPASAAEPAGLPASGVVEVLPSSPILANGAAVELHLVAMGPDGAPLDLSRVRPSVDVGSVGALRAMGPGLYVIPFTPPKSGETATITLKGKSASKVAVDVNATVRLTPAPATRITGTTNPAELVLGQTDSATVSFTGASGKGALAVRAAAGEVENLVAMGQGKHTGRYTPPDVNYPHLGIITATADAGAGAAHGYAVLPLLGNVEYPVQAAPNATVILRIGDKEFGPEQASPQGTASVSVVVPPGVTDATLVSVVDGESTEEIMDLRVPETRTMALFPTPDTLPTGVSVPVRAVMLTPDGKQDAKAKLVFEASKGEVGAAKHIGNGVYEATWTVGSELGTAKVTVKVEGSTVQTDELELELVPGLPAAVSMVADPPVVTPDVKKFTVTATIDGQGTLDLIGEGASIEGSVKGKANVFEATFGVVPDTTPQVHAVLARSGTTGPVAGLVLVPARENLPADGESTTRVDVVAVDAFGLPVKDVKVTLELVSGGGKVPETVTTASNGIAAINYTVGAASGVAHLRATAGSASADLGLLLMPPGVGPTDLPRSGSRAAQEQAWEGLLPSLWLGEDAAGPAVAVYPVGPADAAIVRMDIQADPPSVRPGEEVRIVASALSAADELVPKASVDALTSAGTLGGVDEAEPGQYSVVLTAPDEEGTVKVSVLTGGVMGLVEITVDKNAAVPGSSPWGGAVADATPDAEPEAEKPPKEPKEKKPKAEAGDYPWLRVRGSGVGSLYAYSQVPGEEPGQLLPSSVTVEGGNRAVPFGYELDARAWQPGVKYLGYHLLVRQSRYSIAIANGEAADWLYQIEGDVVGRVPIDVRSSQIWVGGKAGVHFNDFMVFTGCLDQGCSIDYGPLGLPGLALGIEAGTEIGSLYAIAGFTQGFGNFAFPYSTAFDLNAGYHITTNFFVDLGFGTMSRKVVLEGEDSGSARGELTDGLLAFELGVGFAL